MSNSTIRAALDDGPRVGEVLDVEAEQDGAAPATLVVSDPLSDADGPTETTTYHLHHEGTEPGSYVYRTGNSSDDEGEPDDEAPALDEAPAGESGEGAESEQP